MSGGSESSGQGPGNQSPGPPSGNRPPWERQEPQPPPTEETRLPGDDAAGYGQQQGGETIFGGDLDQSQGYGQQQGGETIFGGDLDQSQGYGQQQGGTPAYGTDFANQGGHGYGTDFTNQGDQGAYGAGQQPGYGFGSQRGGGETVFGGQGFDSPGYDSQGDVLGQPAADYGQQGGDFGQASDYGQHHTDAGQGGEKHIPAIPEEEHTYHDTGYPGTGYPDQGYPPGPQGPYGGQQPPLGGMPPGGYAPGYQPHTGGPQGPPPYGGGPPGPGGGGGGGGSKTPLIVALVVVGVLVLGALSAGGVAIYRASSDPTPTPTSTSSSPAPTLTTPTGPTATASTSPLPLPERINERSADPSPLTAKELYPSSYKGDDGYSYKRYATKIYKSCGSAVQGSRLRSELKQAKCTEVAAGTYVDKKHKIVITIGLANTTDLAAATSVSSAVNPSSNVDFVPLNGKSPARFYGKSFLEGHEAIGHFTQWYATTFTNRSPSKTESRQKFYDAYDNMSDMINIALSKRMINASP